MSKSTLDKLKTAIADYIDSEGCSCCRNQSEHDHALNRIAKILKVNKYPDDSDWNFEPYLSKK